jgi:hypothetical protein
MGQWKGLVESVADGCTDMQLYTIKADPREHNNVAQQHPEVVAAMWRAIKQSHTKSNHPLFNLDITFPHKNTKNFDKRK